MAVPTLSTIPLKTGELMRALIGIESGGNTQAWWIDARLDPPARGALDGGSLDVAGSGDGDITRWRYRWNGDRLLINKGGSDNTFLEWVTFGGLLAGKYLFISTDTLVTPLKFGFSAYFTAGAGFCNLTLATSDQTLLNGLVDGDTLNLVIGNDADDTSNQDIVAAFTLGTAGFSAVLGIEDATEQDRAADFALGVPTFSGALDKTEVGEHDSAADFALGIPSFSVALAKRVPADRTGPIATSLDAGIAQMKRTLLAGGLLRSIEWHQRTGDKDERGRQAVSVSLLDALIEQRPALDRSTIDTDRTDNTLLIILDPVAITDEDTFRWGDHVYKVSKIDGVVKNEGTGVRFSSEVTVIR